ncbi:MAG: iron-sulfur cluster assembly scaffold protein [Candidatus Thermoplasmatota archaeon]|nr:iron-sulfur cluster assembly scaffold protein [Candidatus Thermoplasmatota archaeon]
MNMFDINDIAMDIEDRIRKDEKKKFSARVLKEAYEAQNIGRIEDPDGCASITGPCGDTMEFSIKVKDSRISDIRFMTDGCGSSIACGSATTKMALGRTLETALNISDIDILNELGGLPEENRHCAKLAADTLRKAFRNYQEKGR